MSQQNSSGSVHRLCQCSSGLLPKGTFSASNLGLTRFRNSMTSSLTTCSCTARDIAVLPNWCSFPWQSKANYAWPGLAASNGKSKLHSSRCLGMKNHSKAGTPRYMGGSINGGTQNGWFMMENPIKMTLKWMIYGYPYFKKPPYCLCSFAEIRTAACPPALALRQSCPHVSNARSLLSITAVWRESRHSRWWCYLRVSETDVTIPHNRSYSNVNWGKWWLTSGYKGTIGHPYLSKSASYWHLFLSQPKPDAILHTEVEDWKQRLSGQIILSDWEPSPMDDRHLSSKHHQLVILTTITMRAGPRLTTQIQHNPTKRIFEGKRHGWGMLGYWISIEHIEILPDPPYRRPSWHSPTTWAVCATKGA